MIDFFGWMCGGLLLALTALILYEWLLALAALAMPPPRLVEASSPPCRFVVLIPAHDEEAGLPATLRSIRHLEYPAAYVRTVVVADRCHDGTVAVARRAGAICLDRRAGTPGKGQAIAWALDELSRAGIAFDAVVIVDADTLVDPRLLAALADGLRRGHDVQQGYNYLSNPWESGFTRIIAVTSILRNRLYYGGKRRLGLPAMLTGTGMCFSRVVLDRHPWSAFSVGEDWEFSASLLLHGEHIWFNEHARVYARESGGFRQASSQRLRWAGGRHSVAATGGRRLLRAGIGQRRIDLCDAALNLAAPTYSVQAVAAFTLQAAAVALVAEPEWRFLLPWAAIVLGLLSAYFAVGVALCEAPGRALVGIAMIPLFLPWRLAIEVLGLLGYGRRQWVRTSRLSPSR
jgi:glycosyltransferase involved in cell wall biosynthesis